MTLPSQALARFAFPLMAVAALAACGKAEDTTYEADVTDESGGDLIVTEQTPTVDVDLPETPMTPVPAESGDAGAQDTGG